MHFEAISFWLPLGSVKLHFSLKNVGPCTKAHCFPTSLVTGEAVEPLLHFSRSHPASMQGRPSFPCPCPRCMPASPSSNELLLEFVRFTFRCCFSFTPPLTFATERRRRDSIPRSIRSPNSNFGCSPLPLSQNRRVRQVTSKSFLNFISNTVVY